MFFCAQRYRFLCVALLLALFSWITGCSDSDEPTRHPENICKIFTQHPDWFGAARDAEMRWKIPIAQLMAIIYQESHYVADASPDHSFFSTHSAKGYAQAINSTWREYCQRRGLVTADRQNFSDAIDFIGWYLDAAHRQLNIAKNDAYHMYLVYHEGFSGYASKSYASQAWLQRIAHKVQENTRRYQQQLIHCAPLT